MTVHQLVGSEHAIDMELPLLTDVTARFEMITPDSTIDLLNEVTDPFQLVEPVFERRLDFDGLALLVMDHHFIYTEFSREKFLEYLDHEELPAENYLDQMKEKPTQTERYARYFKCLVQVGAEKGGVQHQQVTGQKLEILLKQNPFQLDPGDELEVRILFDGRPLPNQLVTTFTSEGEKLLSKCKERTDDQGMATFKLEQKGRYLIRLVHLFPCKDPYTDWESHWATYCFKLD